MVEYFFTEDYPFDTAGREKVFKKGEPLARLDEALELFKKLEKFDHDSIYNAVCEMAEKAGRKSNDTSRLSATP